MPEKRTIPRVCETCSAPFFVYPNWVKYGGGRFCSRQCSGLSRLTPTTLCSCDHCGAEYEMRTSLLGKDGPEKNRGRYCSLACKHDGRRRSIDDIWQFIDKREPDECWPVTCGKRPQGYGRIMIARQVVSVTRVVLGLKLGRPLDDDEFALHTCDNPPCANPAHLYAGDVQQNSDDKVERSRQARGEGHGMARLTEAQVREIRAIPMHRNPTNQEIAARYGVSKDTICLIRASKTWKHVI